MNQQEKFRMRSEILHFYWLVNCFELHIKRQNVSPK
jgi:hypothetical protein